MASDPHDNNSKANAEEETCAPGQRQEQTASKHVGPYKLLQQIGEGGMGTVWMAQQEVPVRRRVALKLIKGAKADKQIVARFEAERQALAMMDHQHIAKVLDAGTTLEGNPYFVMELVNGIPINAYCDRNKLNPKERLKLFVPVCKAIQHAHQKGIIHRDLKPSNVLVQMYDGEPVAKVIDFGLAKALQYQTKLTDKTMFTEYGQVVGTLQYMSPEQATMDALAVDTRTDIYSLGVMLYELLAGSTPVESRTLKNNALLQVLEVIREKEPPKPSHRLSNSGENLQTISDLRQIQPAKLRQILRGELDWIVMKALEKDRTRRYETANDFAQDINNFLSGDTVLARPPSSYYQLKKFAFKHKGLVASLIAVGLALLIGIFGTTYGLIRAEEKAADAIKQKRFADSKSSEAEQERKRANVERDNARASERIARINEERAKIEQAEREITSNHDFDRAFKLLEECSTQRGSWEWNYLNRRLDGPDQSLLGHTKGLWSAEFSPDGLSAVTASIDGSVRIWDLESSTARTIFAIPDIIASDGSAIPAAMQLMSLIGMQTPPIMRARFSPDGKTIASGSFSAKLKDSTPVTADLRNSPGVVTQWDVATGSKISSYDKHVGVVMSVAYASDGLRLASSSISADNSFHLWDSKTLETINVFNGHKGTVLRVAFGQKHNCIISVDLFGEVKLWNDKTFEEVSSISAHSAPILDVAVSPDGDRFATASQDGRIKVWSLPDCKLLLDMTGHLGAALGVDYNPDGLLLATAGYDKTVRVWNSKTGELKITLRGHSGVVWTTDFDPSGNKLLSASFDKSAIVWDGSPYSEESTHNEFELIGHRDKPNTIRISPNDKYWVTSSWDHTIKLWSALSGELLKTFEAFDGAVWGLEFKPDSSIFAAASWDGQVGIFDAMTKKLVVMLDGHSTAVHSLAFCRGGGKLATAGFDGRIIIWDARSWKQLKVCDSSIAPVYCVVFSENGKTVYSGGTDRKIKAWDVESGKLLGELGEHEAVVHDLEISNDGAVLYSGSWDSTIKIWDMDTTSWNGEHRKTILAHKEPVNCIKLSPDDKYLVSTSDDKTLRFWDPVTAKEVRPPIYHRGAVWTVEFAPNIGMMATGCWSSQVGVQIHDLDAINSNLDN